MKTNEIIASGLLELYAMGQLTQQEKVLVEENLHIPEVKNELNEIEQSLMEVALLNGINVPKQIKNNLDQLLFSAQENEPKIIQLNTGIKTVNKNNWWAIAASLMLLLSLAGNIFQSINYKEVASQLADLERNNAVMAGEIQVVKQNNTQLATVTEFFKSDHIKTIDLNAVNNKTGDALVYVCMQTGKVAINAAGLPQIDKEHQYQLWALVDGKPVDLGLIPNESLGKSELTLLKVAKGMQAFAITKEVYGGKPTPNLDELIVLGNV